MSRYFPDKPVATVTPIGGPTRAATKGIHPYAAAIRTAWLDRLDQLPRPWRELSYWDDNCFLAARKLTELANSPWAGYAHADAHADYMAHAPYDNEWDGRAKCWNQGEKAATGVMLPEPEPAAEWKVPDVKTLDDEMAESVANTLWTAHPILADIHQAARARIVSPWAVLGSVLARVSASTAPNVHLPPIVGGPASLNYFVALVGRSGAGKGAAYGVAGEVIRHTVRRVTPGSGEGIAHIYRARKQTEGVWGEEWTNETRAALAYYDEIDQLAGQAKRQGATIMPILRTAWSGDTLGTITADKTRALTVPGGQYRFALIAGVQPGKGDALLGDETGGLPQRFLFVPAYDPNAKPDAVPPWPRARDWEPPRWGGSMHDATGRIILPVCDSAQSHIRNNRFANLAGDTDALDGHAELTRLKTAALLGILFGRTEVDDETWEMARLIQLQSNHTRADIQRVLRAESARRTEARAHEESHVDELKELRAEQRRRDWIMRKLQRGALSRQELRRKAWVKDRAEIEGVLERLVADGLVAGDSDQPTRYDLVSR